MVLGTALLEQALTDSGLGAYAPAMTRIARPAIAIQDAACDNDAFAIGASKIGGRPDLEKVAAWPMRASANGSVYPLHFLAQIRLADIAPFEAAAMLPRDGLISFFYDAEDQPWGFAAEDRSGHRIIYQPANTPLSRTEPPQWAGDLPLVVGTRTMNFLPYVSFPNHEWIGTEEFLNDYWDDGEVGFPVALEDRQRLNAFYRLPFAYRHQMFGYARVVQNEMELECELVANGVNTGEAWPDLPANAEAEAKQWWTLLLQLDSLDDDVMWGDGGIIYFWLRSEHIRAADFAASQLILQCS